MTVTAPLFSRVAYGNDLEAFREEKARSAGPVVVLVGGPGSHDVLKDVLSWTDTVAATTEVEPLPLASRLWALDDSKILLSPHNAGVAEDSHIVGARQFAAAAATFAETNEVPNSCQVDIHRGY